MGRAIFAATVAALVPAGALAATSIIDFSETVQEKVYTPLIGVIIGFALVLFLYGVVKYIAHAGDQKAADEGAKMMSYGVLVLFVMVCVWGIVKLGLAFLGFEGGEDASSSSSYFGVSTQSYQPSSSGSSGTSYDYNYSATYDYR
jgi:fumarate reductase subunit D